MLWKWVLGFYLCAVPKQMLSTAFQNFVSAVTMVGPHKQLSSSMGVATWYGVEKVEGIQMALEAQEEPKFPR